MLFFNILTVYLGHLNTWHQKYPSLIMLTSSYYTGNLKLVYFFYVLTLYQLENNFLIYAFVDDQTNSVSNPHPLPVGHSNLISSRVQSLAPDAAQKSTASSKVAAIWHCPLASSDSPHTGHVGLFNHPGLELSEQQQTACLDCLDTYFDSCPSQLS